MYARDTLLHSDSVSTLGKRRRARAYRYEKRGMETRDGKETAVYRGNEREGEERSVYGEKKQKNERCLAGWLGCFSSPPVLSLLLDFARSSVRVGSRAAFIGSLQLASASVCMTKTGKRPSRGGGETTAQRANVGSPREGRS